MPSFALRQGESPHLNLPPRGEEAEPPPLDSEQLQGDKRPTLTGANLHRDSGPAECDNLIHALKTKPGGQA